LTGVSQEDLVEAFFTALFSHQAIEDMAESLTNEGTFSIKKFYKECPDLELIKEIISSTGGADLIKVDEDMMKFVGMEKDSEISEESGNKEKKFDEDDLEIPADI